MSIENSSSVSESLIQNAIQTFENVCQLIDLLHIFSSNETVDDINTGDLKYILSHYYLGQLEQKITENRLDHLKRAHYYLTQFLGRCDSIGILRKEDKMTLHGDETDRFAKRDHLIARAKREKAANTRLLELMKEKEKKLKKYGGDEQSIDFDEENREEALLLLEIAITKSIQSIKIIDQEIQLLQLMPQNKQQQQQQQQPPTPNNNEHSRHTPSFVQAGPILVNKRAQLQAGVFKPDWIQPTMSIEEYGELEYRTMIEREKYHSHSHPKPKEEEEDEDQDIDNPDKLRRAREWDNFKDDNPPGWGNRIGQG